MTRSLYLALVITAAAVAPASAVAQDESVIPVAFPATRYESEWAHSAFHREVVRVIEDQIISDFGRNLVLDGVVDDAVEGPIAFVRNRESGTTFMVTQAQQEGVPFTIVNASQTADPLNTTVKITDGNETATITFDKSTVLKAIDKPSLGGGKKATSSRLTEKVPGFTSQRKESELASEPVDTKTTEPEPGEIKATLARPKEFQPSNQGGANPQSPKRNLENPDRRRIIPSPK